MLGPAAWATLVATILLPLMLALLVRERALRSSAPIDVRWFAFARWIQVFCLLGPLAWITAWVRVAPRMPGFGPDGTLDPFALTGGLLVFLVPLAAVPAALAVITTDVGLRLGTTEIGRRETLRRVAWLMAAAASPAPCIGVSTMAFAHGRMLEGFVALLLTVVVLIACMSRYAKGLELTPHAVTHGEFRDRLFALADRAGVKLRQLYAIPMRRRKLANAFAVSGQQVMVTDLLLDRLSRDEVDAVMAHEIAHLKRGDPVKLLLMYVVVILASWMSLQFFSWGGLMLASTIAVLAALAFLRRMERATDREALKLGANAGALISGLARLARISFIPIRWSRSSGWWLTHPSVEERARSIGRDAGLEPEEIERHLDVSVDAGEHYVLPVEFDVRPPLFSTPFKTRTIQRNVLLLLLAAVAAPAAVFVIARLWGIGGEARLLVTLAAALAGPAAALLIFNFIAVQPLVGLTRALAQRLDLGDRPRDDGWQMAGLSPQPEPRIYEGFSNWELGFVRIHAGELEFAGEQARFTLPAARVTRVECVADLPSWIPMHAVRITWRDDAGGSRALRLTLVGGTGLHAVAALTRRFAADLDVWRSGQGGPAATAASRSLPPTIDVTSADPAATAKPGALVPMFVVDLVFAAVICTLFGLPWIPIVEPGLPEVVLSALATQAFLLFPPRRKATQAHGSAEERRDDGRLAA